MNKNKSPFTKEEIKWWVDLALIQSKIIKIKAEIGKKRLFKAILKIIKKKPLTEDEKRKAFNKEYIRMNEILIERTKERIKKEMEK